MPENHRRPGRRSLAALLAFIVLIVTAGAAAAAPRSARASYPRVIERLAAYAPQRTCSPTAKPGVVDFSRRVLAAYPKTRSLGIVRACRVGGRSEHKEGRAWDWKVSAHNARDRARVKSVFTWLFATDKYGNKYAKLRRLNIQYVIWNKRIWSTSKASAGWRRYTGASSHTDHVHFSFGWPGARKRTSFWTGRVAGLPAVNTAARPKPRPATAPRPTTAPRPAAGAPRPAPRPPASLPAGSPLVDETVRLPANAPGGAWTKAAVVRGQRYLVEVSGSWKWAARAGAAADAECSTTPSDRTWRRHRSVHPGAPRIDHLDLYIDGRETSGEPDTDTGDRCDSRTHTYRGIYTAARSGRVPLRIFEPGSFTDNSGSLTVRLVRVTGRDTVEWSVPANSPTGRTSPAALKGGETYVVTVTGTYDAGNGVTADAECSVTRTDRTWRRHRSVVAGQPGQDSLDVLLDKDGVSGEPAFRQGEERCDALTHTYRFTVRTAETRPVNVRVADPSPRDNAGSLLVRATRLVPVSGVERLAVDAAEPTGATTRRNYPAGTPLTLRVSGTYAAGRGVTADAKCSATAADPSWRSSRAVLTAADGSPLGDLTVDGQVLGWRPTSGSRSCDPDHEYVLHYTPSRPGPIVLTVADHTYTDNAGRLTLTVVPAA